jgi:hypothetical protein
MQAISMLSMKANAVVLIQGTYGWRIAVPDVASDWTYPAQERRVELEIQGDDKWGYHLVMCPEGLSFADSWHATLDDALESARDGFGVPLDAWI